MLAIKNHNIYKKNILDFAVVYKQGCFYALLIPSLNLCLVLLQYARACNILYCNMLCFYCNIQEYAKKIIKLQNARMCKHFLLQYARICNSFIAICKNMQYFYCNWLLIIDFVLQYAMFLYARICNTFIAICKKMHKSVQRFYCLMQEHAKFFYWSIQIYVKFLCYMQEKKFCSLVMHVCRICHLFYCSSTSHMIWIVIS